MGMNMRTNTCIDIIPGCANAHTSDSAYAHAPGDLAIYSHPYSHTDVYMATHGAPESNQWRTGLRTTKSMESRTMSKTKNVWSSVKSLNTACHAAFREMH